MPIQELYLRTKIERAIQSTGNQLLDLVTSGNYTIFLATGYIPNHGLVKQIGLTRNDLDFTDIDKQLTKTTYTKLDMSTARLFATQFKKWIDVHGALAYGSYNPDKTNLYTSIINKLYPDLHRTVVPSFIGDIIIVSK